MRIIKTTSFSFIDRLHPFCVYSGLACGWENILHIKQACLQKDKWGVLKNYAEITIRTWVVSYIRLKMWRDCYKSKRAQTNLQRRNAWSRECPQFYREHKLFERTYMAHQQPACIHILVLQSQEQVFNNTALIPYD